MSIMSNVIICTHRQQCFMLHNNGAPRALTTPLMRSVFSRLRLNKGVTLHDLSLTLHGAVAVLNPSTEAHQTLGLVSRT